MCIGIFLDLFYNLTKAILEICCPSVSTIEVRLHMYIYGVVNI